MAGIPSAVSLRRCGAGIAGIPLYDEIKNDPVVFPTADAKLYAPALATSHTKDRVTGCGRASKLDALMAPPYWAGDREQLIIRIEGVSKSFGYSAGGCRYCNWISHGATASVWSAPRGSGKTTLLRLLAGFGNAGARPRPDRREDVAGRLPSRRPVNVIFQSSPASPVPASGERC